MGPSERRRAILEHLCQKRFDTTKNLAELFGVCERTIRNDLVVLTCSYPIETSFGPYGGIRVANWFHLNDTCCHLNRQNYSDGFALRLTQTTLGF